MTRVASNVPVLDVSAPAIAPAANSHSPSSARRRAPKRSTSAPAGSSINAYAEKYAPSRSDVNALVVCRPRATDGNATVISVPSSCSNAAAAVHAPSRVHAVRGRALDVAAAFTVKVLYSVVGSRARPFHHDDHPVSGLRPHG